jgi:hypothetical protein
VRITANTEDETGAVRATLSAVGGPAGANGTFSLVLPAMPADVVNGPYQRVLWMDLVLTTGPLAAGAAPAAGGAKRRRATGAVRLRVYGNFQTGEAGRRPSVGLRFM